MGAQTAAAAAPVRALAALALRFRAEYREMPGLRLTPSQAARLFGVDEAMARAVLDDLRRASLLRLSRDGLYTSISERTDDMETHPGVEPPVTASLKDAPADRLSCLLRHWAWANEAMERFDREQIDGWAFDDEPDADRPFGSYYHWCALLCGFGDAAVDRGLLSAAQLAAIRPDLDAALPWLRACRQRLVVIPSSLDEPPRVVEVVGDHEALGRLRRLHAAFGEALRQEQMAREVESLDQ